MKNKISRLYLLTYNKVSIIAISPELEMLQKYIAQFKEFFIINQDKFHYRCESDPNKINKLINRYADELIIREFSSHILLTDLEISYHGPIFQELYSDYKRMMATMLKMDDILNMRLELKASMMKNFDELYDKGSSYERFLDNLNVDLIFSNYITDPLTTRFLHDQKNELEWGYRKNMDKGD